MRLVTSMLTKKELERENIETAVKILQTRFQNRAEVQKFKYDDRKYFETDIDLFDVVFSEEQIYEDINKLISAYEEIMCIISMDIDFIAANDDTETEIQKYEKDENDIRDFGLFVTKRKIPGIEPYLCSTICNAYLNLKYVSFGIY